MKKNKIKSEYSAPDKTAQARFFVSNGKTINCRREILGPGTEVFAKDFPGGEETIAEHVENGGLVEIK